jgi:hypothetical protein
VDFAHVVRVPAKSGARKLLRCLVAQQEQKLKVLALAPGFLVPRGGRERRWFTTGRKERASGKCFRVRIQRPPLAHAQSSDRVGLGKRASPLDSCCLE